MSVPAVDAATVMIVRQSEKLEVLMMERHIESDFVGGAFVFPGGKVDPNDRELPEGLWDGIDPDVEGERMDCSAEAALGFYVAAVRECFEEVGILLARKQGRPLANADLMLPAFAEARLAMTSRDSHWSWSDWLKSEELVLDLAALRWWSWWITPIGLHKRFDTRFFVAALPQDQEASHDMVEATDSVWFRPQAALDAAQEGRITLILPTRHNLDDLAQCRTVERVWTRSGDRPPRIHPKIIKSPDGRNRVSHPLFPAGEEV